MSVPAIRIEGLGKCYRLTHGQERTRYRTLRDTLVEAVKSPFRAWGTTEEFWALNDVSFEVQPGEVVGIIGRNGAGKSTLLKILSRITKPTKGRVEINGRVGCLLEVGTGFHPELTGRENVYLNGAILGMNRQEIEKKFDEIVAFAEVEKFLDTPVKRYSSGMYVRLAFAVAAHLEPEILIVDEVLSVGDAGFQNKCFQKMNQVRQNGRTVLVVSHNLGAVQTLCTSAINLESGRLMGQGSVPNQINWYLKRLSDRSTQLLKNRTDREGDGRARVVRVNTRVNGGPPGQSAICAETLTVEVVCEVATAGELIDCVALSFWTQEGLKVAHVDNLMTGSIVTIGGLQRLYSCHIPRVPLPAGSYIVNVAVYGGGQMRDHIYAATELDVDPGDYFRTGQTTNPDGGLVLLDHTWQATAV
jgi:lipopolysaccharide transport system ATP-binding protein